MSNSVVLDFGHGGRDPGALGIKTQEKNNNLTLGLKVGKMLQQHGVTVSYTRDTDKDFCSGAFDLNTDLQNRIAIAKQFSPDVFCSFHNNAFNKQAKGLEVHCFKTGGGDQRLAQRVLNQLSNLPFINRNTKVSNFYVLRKFDGTNTDACLIEYGFIDSEEDAILANMDKASVLIAKGLLEHLGIEYKEQVTLTIQTPIPPSPIVSQIAEGGKKLMKNLVTYKYEPDSHASFYLASSLQCPIIHADLLTQDIIDNCQNIFQVGGTKINEKFVLLSGNDRYDSILSVLRHIGKL
jgi:N-acetylmuramoyl-L-alanine amidase